MRVMELHAPIRVVQRSKGRTATAAAAYRAAARIECERTGQVHDYTRRQRGVEATEMHVADDAPDWARDRASLWNAAEMREKHPKAQTAREVEVAFPSEFDAEQRREAGRNIARLFVSRYGSAADVAWHFPSRKGDQRNHHAHILFTGRPLTSEGWAKNKRLALDDRRQGREEVSSLRAAIAGVMNEIAARDRLNVYVEHLSFEARGLDQEATQHLGPDASEMERRGEETEIGSRNRDARTRNEEREELREERARVLDFADAQKQHRRRNPWEVFYRDMLGRRAAVSQDLEARFGQQERDAALQAGTIRAAQAERNLFGRLWSRVTGRTREETRELERLAEITRTIERHRREAQEAFERERNAKLEALKDEIAAAERQDQERFEDFQRAHGREREPEHTSPEEERTALDAEDDRGAVTYEDHEQQYMRRVAQTHGQPPPADSRNRADTEAPGFTSVTGRSTYESAEAAYLRGTAGSAGPSDDSADGPD